MEGDFKVPTIEPGTQSFVVAVPEKLRSKDEDEKLDDIEHIRFTLVDCHGHDNLMKTMIGRVSIID